MKESFNPQLVRVYCTGVSEYECEQGVSKKKKAVNSIKLLRMKDTDSVNIQSVSIQCFVIFYAGEDCDGIIAIISG